MEFITHLTEYFDGKFIGDLVTGLVTSVVFLFFLFALKPSIAISPRISSQYTTINGQKERVYYFKVINKGWVFKIYDITVRAYVCETIRTANGENLGLQELELRGMAQWGLNKLNLKHCFQDFFCGESTLRSRSDYAIQFASSEKIKNLLNHNNRYITLQVVAKHSLTGFTSVETKHYRHLSKVEDGTFLSGNSYKVVKNVHEDDNIVVT